MSTQCPQCGQAISEDFGVIACPHCQALLFVDLNGDVQLSDSSTLEQAAEQEEAVFVDPQADQETVFGTLARFQPSAEPSLPSTESVVESENNNFLLHETAEEFPLPQEPAESFEPSIEEEKEIPSPDPLESTDSAEELFLEDAPLQEDFVDQEVSTGPLTYTVTIERIDTKTLRAQLREAFDDPKFQWSSGDLMRRIHQGRLTLKNLSPVKASVLVARLRELPLKISWTQQVFK
jgi:hypothetical protein